MYCKYCGNLIDDNSTFCGSCGQKIIENTKVSKPKGSGKAIASMVLGIVACVWSFITLLSFEELPTYSNYFSSFAEFIGFFIGYNLFSLPTGIVGLCLGLSSKVENGKRTSGLILSTISIAITTISLIILLVNHNF